MNIEQKFELNHFFVDTFNKVMSYEEQCLTTNEFHNLSVKEFHAIEAVAEKIKTKQNTMSNIATYLSISVGALTTTMNVLVNKGYVLRRGSTTDRRIIYIHLSPSGKKALEHHRQFHAEMIDTTAKLLDDEEITVLINSLKKLSLYFHDKLNESKKTEV